MVPVIYQQSPSQQRETAAAGLQPAGVFAQLMKNISEVVIFGLQSAASKFEQSEKYFFLNIIFMRGKTFVGCVLGEFIWLRISLKTNPEGRPPPAQPAFNLFLSPAKACPFKVPAASSAARSLQSPAIETKKTK